MRSIAKILLAGLLSASAVFAQAEQKQQIGDWEVHYSAFNSTFLTPEIAAQYNLVRSEKRGLVNIAILDATRKTAIEAEPKGYVTNPRGGVQDLEFQQIVEGDSVYYLASFLFGDGELMRFSINFPSTKNTPQTLTFEQKLFKE